MKRAVFAAAVAALIQPTGAQAAEGEPRVLVPSSGWTLDFADERCSLIREFADGDDRIRLQIDSFGPAPGYHVMISGDLVVGSDAAPITEFRVGYSPDTRERERMSMIFGRLGADKAVSFGPGFLPDVAAPPPAVASATDGERGTFEDRVTSVTIQFRRGKPFRLETGSMAAPFTAMRQCVDGLLASWGIDPEQHRARSRPPMLIDLPEGYIRVEVDLEDDRPGYTERRYQAIARDQAGQRSGLVARGGYAFPVRVMIDATGQSTACVLQVANANEGYRRSVCETFAGPYQPALDAEGRPIASFVQVGLNSSTVQIAEH